MQAAQLQAAVNHNPEHQPNWDDVALALDRVWDAVERRDRPKAIEHLLYTLVDLLGYRELPTLLRAWAAVGAMLVSDYADLSEIAADLDDATYEALAAYRRTMRSVPTLESEGIT